jgi:uncharacterized Zn finger protein (UPF0148 family)
MSELHIRTSVIAKLIEEGYRYFMVEQDGCNECGEVVFKEVKSEYVCAVCGTPYGEED